LAGNSKEFLFTEGGKHFLKSYSSQRGIGRSAMRIGSSYWTKVFGSHGFSSGKVRQSVGNRTHVVDFSKGILGS
jgi:hypothetical protein